MIGRRPFLAGTAAVLLSPALAAREAPAMYGLIGKMSAKPGQRDAVIALILKGAEAMPGCLSYVVAKDAGDPNGIWITEVWDSAESHAASLKIPAVADAIRTAIPLIDMAADGLRQATVPVGGIGLRPA
jgi:quinol monooxygenase YgiN